MSKPKKYSIKWHEQELARKRKERSDAGRKGGIANSPHKNYKEGYGNTVKDKTKDPKPRYRSRVDYDFLKYIRLVFKWAQENYNLNRPKIELMLFLYGTGAFSKKQFNDFHKVVGMYADKSLKNLIDEGWVTQWRPANRYKKIHALYTLTQKAKIMCNKMHKYSCGIDEIPLTPDKNILVQKKEEKRINSYYLDAIKRMNKDKAPKD